MHKPKPNLVMRKLLNFFVLAAFASIVFTACNNDDDSSTPVTPEPPTEELKSIVAIASETPELSILVEALTKYPNLVNTLSGEGSFTVFAPTNDAFTALLGVTGQSSLDDIPENVLERVLQYHVISGAGLLSTDLSDGQTAATVLGDEVTVGVSESGVTINSANVTAADVEASNGVVHIVDAVLVPMLEASIVNTVVEPAYFNKNFTILTEAVVTAGLLNTLIDPNATFTVFAPTNEAFAAAGITSLEGLTADDLTPILLYHVLGAEVPAGSLPPTGSAVTTLGGDFYLSINENGVFINGSTQVVATDVEANNGVVHVIDRTLLPPTSNVVEIAVAASQADAGAEFTQLVAALVAAENDPNAANLVTALSGEGPFTVFAPTDAAFAQLYADAGVANLEELVAAVGMSTIEAVLTYHVVGGARVMSTDLPNLDSSTITALGGTFELDVNALTITETDGALNLNENNTANITGVDILGTNGVIHVIDKVILP